MIVTITTEGGFTGRGIGSASADVDDARMARLHPERWKREYRARGNDLVRYTLTFGATRVRWVDGAELPDDLRALWEEVWRAGHAARPPEG
jgi:hypothetical protein